MTWRLAKSLAVLREQINSAYPQRSKASDGSIGDEAHSSRVSDHNPNHAGVVCAVDITNDPKHGIDSHKLAEALRASRDPRIKYIISRRQICSALVAPWVWRPYSGSNPHDKHVHVSVRDAAHLYDDASPWKIAIAGTAIPKRHVGIVATVFGGEGDDQQSAYGGMVDHDKPGVALPARFKGNRPRVRVFHNGASVICDIVDVGPWNILDPYWEHDQRPQAESGRDRKGRKTNLAGIDLTPRAAALIGLKGKGKVDWEFVE